MEHGTTVSERVIERAPRAPLTPAERRAIAVVAVAMALFGVYGRVTGAPSTVAYLCTVAAVGVIVARARRAALPPWLATALAVLTVAHLAGGLVRVGADVLYNASLWGALLRYDHFVHASGVLIGTLTIWTLVLAPLVAVEHRGQAAIAVAVLGGLGLGALNETIEFLSTTAHGGAHVGGYTNTGWDLVSNVVGAGVAGVLVRRRTT